MPKRPLKDVSLEAEQFFTLYYALGVDRSLIKARDYAGRVGVRRPSITTLERWSSRYRWQERIRDLDEASRRSMTERHILEIQRMNEDQAAVGGMGVQLAAFALERMLRQLRMPDTCEKCGLAPLDLGAMDVSRVMDVFAKWQRLGLGQATDRSEVEIMMWNVAIPEIIQLFLLVNIYEEAERRKREFAVGMDDIVGRHVQASREA